MIRFLKTNNYKIKNSKLMLMLICILTINCNCENRDMKNSIQKELQASSVMAIVRMALKIVVGKNYRQTITFYEDIPKGLFCDGKLMLPIGLNQKITIYGDLLLSDINAIIKELFKEFSKYRNNNYAPIIIEFYKAEVFKLDKYGSTSRGKEELIAQFVFPEK